MLRVFFSAPLVTRPLGSLSLTGFARFSTKPLSDKIYTKEEVAKHNTEEDCWMIINGYVYDVSEYVGEHPGGDVILDGAGTDATADFEGNEHSDAARELLSDFCIGRLKE